MKFKEFFKRETWRRWLRRLPLPRVVKENPFFTLAYLGLLAFAALAIFIFVLAQTLPSVEEISSRQIEQSTKIYDRKGETVLYEPAGGERRTVVPLSEMPAFLRDATIAIEDQRFYEESAVSFRGIVRAFLINLLHAEVVQGGSTITQQLARNAFLTLEQTPTRKLKELILAVRIDRVYTKDQILELYLNEVPYGPTLYGVEAASQAYFQKSVRDLNLAESAALAAIPKAPSYYNPWGSHTKELLARQNLVLKKMRELGKISEQELQDARGATVAFAPQRESIKAPHFVFAVQDYLVKKYGEEMVRRGGLRVITTLDLAMQEIAERVVKEGADRNTELYKGTNAALTAMDPTTGQVLALVGSRDFFDREHEGNFNVALQGLRQPGSALKPFVYLTAFKKGFAPESVVFDMPTEFVPNNPNCPETPDFENENPRCFHPENFDERFAGPVPIRQALAHSRNVPAVKILYLAGVRDTLKTLNDFGVTTLTDPSRYGLSLVLGGGEVKLAELTGAYGVLAADGIKHERGMVLEVKNAKGETLEQWTDSAARVVDAQYPRLVNDILSDVSARAGLFSGSLSLTTFPGREIALKTGTTNNYRDAWTVGYTPSLVVGVWAGNNDNKPMQKRGSSILAAVPIWNAFMKEVVNDLPIETFARPAPVSPEKPVLRGEYVVGNQVHTVLYYVNKNDPRGPAPLNPEDDPQFRNWEMGVQSWAFAHAQEITASSTASSSGAFGIRLDAPASGSFVDQQGFLVAGQVTGAGESFSGIRTYMNGAVVQDFIGSFQAPYSFSFTVAPINIQGQNLLEVELLAADGMSKRTSAIVYKRE